MENNNDIYNTTVYTDYCDLPITTQKALYKEWCLTNPAENKFRVYLNVLFFMLAGFSIVLIIIPTFLYIYHGFGWTVIALYICAAAGVIACIIVNSKHSKLNYDQSIRFSKWLEKEKRIIATVVTKK